MRISRHFTRLALVLALGCVAASAHAAPTPKEKQEAKQLVAEAKKAAKAGAWEEVVKDLRRADELDPSPQTKIDLATGLAQTKKLKEASSILHNLIDSPTTDKKSADAARKALAEFEARVPWLGVSVSGATGARVTVDGEAFDASAEAPVDPGEHTVAAEADGYERAETKVTVAEGEHGKASLTLKKIGKADDGDKRASSGGSKLPAVIAFGVGAVGLGVGAAFGVMAFGETSDVEKFCKTGSAGTVCPRSQTDALDQAKTKGTISTVGFIVGGVGVATGVVLLLTGGGSKKSSAEGALEPEVHPYVAADQVGVVGTF